MKNWIAHTALMIALALPLGSASLAAEPEKCPLLEGHWKLKSTDNPTFGSYCYTPLWSFNYLSISQRDCSELKTSWRMTVGRHRSFDLTVVPGTHQIEDLWDVSGIETTCDSKWSEQEDALELKFNVLNNRDKTGVHQLLTLSRSGDSLVVVGDAVRGGHWKPGPVPFPTRIRCEFVRTQ